MGVNRPSSVARDKKKSSAKIEPFPEFEAIPVLTDTSSRLEYIIGLMIGLQWQTGKSGRILAKRWGLSYSSLKSLASEASRVVRADRESSAVDITVIATNMLRDCYSNGDVKGAAMIGKLLADVSGANAPIVQEITIDSELDPAKAKALTNKLFAGGVSKDDEEDKSVVTELFDDSSTDENAQ